FANPLHEASVLGAAQEGFDEVQGLGAAAAGGGGRRLRPFINHRKRQTQFGGNLLRAAFLKHFSQNLVRLHGDRKKGGLAGGKQNRDSGSAFSQGASSWSGSGAVPQPMSRA